jgi:hypothetical protein
MPNVSIQVGGQTVIIPGVYVSDTVNPSVPSGLLPTGPLVFLAFSYGGQYLVPQNFTDANSLQAAMRGAPSSDLVPFMFNPSSELNGTSFVTLIPVGPNTTSTGTMVSSGSTVVASGISVQAGTPSNLITYSIAQGTLSGTIVTTITDGFSGQSYTSYNLGIPFQLAYTGAATGVTYTVSSTITGRATKLQITSPNPGESVTIDLTSSTYTTIANVIEEIEGTGYYTCNLLGNGELPSYYLDIISNASLPKPVSTVNQYVNVTATLGDIVYWLNTFSSSIATWGIPNGVTSAPGLQPVPISLSYFTGATNQVPSNSNYAAGFNAALNVPAWVIMADTQSTAVQALGAQHAATANSLPYQAWRRFVTGSQLGETYGTAITNARDLNEFFCSYFWPGIQATNVITGVNQTYDGLHVAAAAAGMMTGNPVATPLTNKTLLGNGVETTTSLANMIALQDGGVLVLNYPTTTKIPTFLSDVTTWQNDSNPANVFNQQVACRFALNYYLVTQLQPYVGTVASNFTEANILNATAVALNSVIQNGLNSAGILNSWDPNSLKANYVGAQQALYISVAVVFVGQNRFIVCDVTINPLNINISSTGTITNT